MGEIRIKRDVSDAIVYGFHVDPSISDPSNAVTYLEDAVGMIPASMGSTSFNSGSWADVFFMPKPCMVRYDGTVDYYLDPSDYSKKADGTASDIADPNYAGNAMMEWGLIYFKFEPGEADGEGYFYVSNKKVNDSFNCWCNYDANNNITQHFYTAIYNGTGVDKLRSISGVQLTPENGSGNTTGQQEISRAMANNTSDLTEWYIDLWADEILTTGLLYLLGKSLNLQAIFGRGLDSGRQAAKEAYITGTLNDKGLFWGTTANGDNAVKVFGMENFWGCAWHRTAGLFGTADGYAYKLTHSTVDGSTATSFGTNANGYIPVTVTQPESGYVTKMSFGKYGMLPSAIGGSTSTYYADYFNKGESFSIVGGSSNIGFGCGFFVSLNTDVDSNTWNVSASLSLKPRAKAPYNPDWDNRPAHQFTNGQFVDIPTHHYTNGRWQGELTSQSPLKFRADGDMLDWRVEGKTSPEPETIVYGFHVNPNIQDPSNAVTYLEDAVGMTPASMGSTSFNAGSWADAFFIPKPCMVRYDGTVDYYLDPSDYSKKADGTASDIADPNYAGNAMMEWGLIWYKFDTENLEEGEVNFYVSNKQVDDSYHCWCNYDADGNIIPHFYTAIYNGTGTDKLRSISGVQLTPENGSGNTTGQQEITRATANNTTTKTEWYIDILADRELINMLLVLIGKSLNCQAVFGRGLDSGSQAAKEAYVTGTLDDKGLFWGDTGNGANAVKVFGMENYWGCVWHRVAGMVSVYDNTTNSNTFKIKLTHSTIDGTTVNGFNNTGDGYIDTGVEVATNVGVYIRKMKYFDKGYSPLLTTGGSSATYYSDYTSVNYTGTYYLIAGGYSGSGLSAGSFCSYLRVGFSYSHWDLAASLSLKPRAKAPYNPHNGVGDWDETTQRYKIPVTVNGTTTNLYTDHQLMDGDSIDYATDQTAIPLATGNNTLTVDTAVQPKSVFVKFEG